MKKSVIVLVVTGILLISLTVGIYASKDKHFGSDSDGGSDNGGSNGGSNGGGSDGGDGSPAGTPKRFCNSAARTGSSV